MLTMNCKVPGSGPAGTTISISLLFSVIKGLKYTNKYLINKNAITFIINPANVTKYHYTDVESSSPALVCINHKNKVIMLDIKEITEV